MKTKLIRSLNKNYIKFPIYGIIALFLFSCVLTFVLNFLVGSQVSLLYVFGVFLTISLIAIFILAFAWVVGTLVEHF